MITNKFRLDSNTSDENNTLIIINTKIMDFSSVKRGAVLYYMSNSWTNI
jgi:hypothetical protein